MLADSGRGRDGPPRCTSGTRRRDRRTELRPGCDSGLLSLRSLPSLAANTRRTRAPPSPQVAPPHRSCACLLPQEIAKNAKRTTGPVSLGARLFQSVLPARSGVDSIVKGCTVPSREVCRRLPLSLTAAAGMGGGAARAVGAARWPLHRASLWQRNGAERLVRLDSLWQRNGAEGVARRASLWQCTRANAECRSAHHASAMRLGASVPRGCRPRLYGVVRSSWNGSAAWNQ